MVSELIYRNQIISKYQNFDLTRLEYVFFIQFSLYRIIKPYPFLSLPTDSNSREFVLNTEMLGLQVGTKIGKKVCVGGPFIAAALGESQPHVYKSLLPTFAVPRSQKFCMPRDIFLWNRTNGFVLDLLGTFDY